MATQLQIRRDTAADLVSVTPVEGEPGYDQTNKRMLVGDGSRAQGIPIPSLTDVHGQTFVAATAGGTADALTLDLADGTLDYNPDAYAKFQRFVFEAASNNTGAATLNVNSLGAKTIKKYDSDGAKADLDADDLVSGSIYSVTYDGTHFILGVSSGGGGGGMVHLLRSTPSAVASADLTGFTDPASYDAYLIVFELEAANDGQDLWLRTSTDNGSTFDSGASDYLYAGYSITTAVGTVDAHSTTGDSKIIIGEGGPGNAAGEKIAGNVLLYRPDDAADTYLTFDVTSQTGTTANRLSKTNGGGRRKDAADVDAIQFLFASGNVGAGEINVYGLKNA